MNKNTTLYALAFAIVFLVIYALFTFLWKLLVRSVFVREENYQTEKSGSSALQFRRRWI